MRSGAQGSPLLLVCHQPGTAEKHGWDEVIQTPVRLQHVTQKNNPRAIKARRQWALTQQWPGLSLLPTAGSWARLQETNHVHKAVRSAAAFLAGSKLSWCSRNADTTEQSWNRPWAGGMHGCGLCRSLRRCAVSPPNSSPHGEPPPEVPAEEALAGTICKAEPSE